VCGSHGTSIVLPRQTDRISRSPAQLSAAGFADGLVHQYPNAFVCVLGVCVLFAQYSSEILKHLRLRVANRARYCDERVTGIGTNLFMAEKWIAPLGSHMSSVINGNPRGSLQNVVAAPHASIGWNDRPCHQTPTAWRQSNRMIRPAPGCPSETCAFDRVGREDTALSMTAMRCAKAIGYP
jgi:hypothetical protein